MARRRVTDAYAKVDTVADVEVKDELPLTECTGYQDDGHDTDNNDTDNKVDLRSATYTVSVRESKDDLIAFLKPFVQP